MVKAARDRRAVIAQLSRLVEGGPLRPLESPSGDANHIISAVNELVGVAERAVTDAALKVKEIEIQLKVATAQRQHAEAIIYSISDAVLVTDPFHALRVDEVAEEVGLHATTSPVDDSPIHGAAEWRRMVAETAYIGVGRVIGFRRLEDIIG